MGKARGGREERLEIGKLREKKRDGRGEKRREERQKIDKLRENKRDGGGEERKETCNNEMTLGRRKDEEREMNRLRIE